ncbi:MAG: hypothetical protein DRO67_03975, partial [Candidatus Asgardarchaeum californiense]
MLAKKITSMEAAIHQLNEQLQVIRSSVEHLAMILDLSKKEHSFLDNIIEAVDKITDISTNNIERSGDVIIKIDAEKMSKKVGATILVIEDEEDIVDVYKSNLEMLGFKMFSAGNFIDGMKILNKEHIDIVVLDVMLPDAYGLDCIDTILASNKDIKIVVTTGKIDELYQDLTHLV